jgi:hypothetical protein
MLLQLSQDLEWALRSCERPFGIEDVPEVAGSDRRVTPTGPSRPFAESSGNPAVAARQAHQPHLTQRVLTGYLGISGDLSSDGRQVRVRREGYEAEVRFKITEKPFLVLSAVLGRRGRPYPLKELGRNLWNPDNRESDPSDQTIYTTVSSLNKAIEILGHSSTSTNPSEQKRKYTRRGISICDLSCRLVPNQNPFLQYHIWIAIPADAFHFSIADSSSLSENVVMGNALLFALRLLSAG